MYARSMHTVVFKGFQTLVYENSCVADPWLWYSLI